MRKNGLFLVFFFTILTINNEILTEFYARQTCPFTTFIGSIRFPLVITNNPPLIAYYKGNKINIHEGSYELKEQRSEHEFHFLFTLQPLVPQSACKSDQNTINKLVLPQKTPYKCFKIIKVTNRTSPDNKSWKVQEVSLPTHDNACTVIPENTIIVLANPLFIEKLEPAVWKSVNATFKLPTIVFKERISKISFDEMLLIATLTSLDVDPFHCKPTIIKEMAHNNQSAVLSLPGN